VTGTQNGPNDAFVFETLWYGRGSFVVDSIARINSLPFALLELLEQRHSTRARVAQTVHIIWDVSVPLPESLRDSLVKLAQVTGFSLFICHTAQSNP
jgi:hypothetical protein